MENLADEGLKQVKKEDGDITTVLNNLRSGIREHRNSIYAFSRGYLEMCNSLFIFVPKTRGWEVYKNTLIPCFNKDLAAHNREKEKAKNWARRDLNPRPSA